MTAINEAPPAMRAPTRFLWLDLTRKCQLTCAHCYNASGPRGTHGTMTRADWIGVLDQAAACGVRSVQLIGGEPTLHPHAAELVEHAVGVGLETEVFSNLVRVTEKWWELFRRAGVTVATSYYSDRAEEHDAMTGRRSHARTRANIREAVRRGVSLRVGVIGDGERQANSAWRDLESLGVTRIGVDHVRPFGRGARDEAPDPANLCGRCGTGRAAVGPTGEVSPCVFAGWMGVGNVRDVPLSAILSSALMAEANASISRAIGGRDCYPNHSPCSPHLVPPVPCGPDRQCQPGYDTDRCVPRD